MEKDPRKIKKKIKPEVESIEQPIEELVNASGITIKGDFAGSSNKITSKKTTDSNVKRGRQKNLSFNAPYGTYTAGYGRGRRNPIAEAEVKVELDEIARRKMRGMIENLLNQDTEVSDVLPKRTSPDRDVVNNKETIPNIDELSDDAFDEPLMKKYSTDLINRMMEHQVSGEIKGIILNYIIDSIDINDIPSQFKRILKDKF